MPYQWKYLWGCGFWEKIIIVLCLINGIAYICSHLSLGWRVQQCSLRASQPARDPKLPSRFCTDVTSPSNSLTKETPSSTFYLSQQAVDISIVIANHHGSIPITTHRLRQASIKVSLYLTRPDYWELIFLSVRRWNDREQSYLQLELERRGRHSKQRCKCALDYETYAHPQKVQ